MRVKKQPHLKFLWFYSLLRQPGTVAGKFKQLPTKIIGLAIFTN
jgi:hypothetical protein